MVRNSREQSYDPVDAANLLSIARRLISITISNRMGEACAKFAGTGVL
jgi:hypothetical protein